MNQLHLTTNMARPKVRRSSDSPKLTPRKRSFIATRGTWTTGAIILAMTESKDFPNVTSKNKPSSSSVLRVVQKLKKHHTLGDRRKSNGPAITHTTRANADRITEVDGEISQAFGGRRHASLNYTARRLKLGKATVLRIRRSKTLLNQRFYKKTKAQWIPPRAEIQRIAFAEWAKEEFENEDGTVMTKGQCLVEHAVIYDETQVELDEHFNPKNQGMWAEDMPGEENIHSTVSKPLKVMAFVCISKLLPGNGIHVGFIEGTLDKFKYKNLLRYKIIPHLKRAMGENFAKAWWLEDGAPPHWAHIVSDYLDRTFEGKVVARDFKKWHPSAPGMNWPAYSPDCTVLDYWANTALKKLTWELENETGLIKTVEDLKHNFVLAAKRIGRDESHRAMESLTGRLKMLEMAKGGRFEKYSDKMKKNIEN